jgi:LmbE family N-acetylglucosaminyl deacetylase
MKFLNGLFLLFAMSVWAQKPLKPTAIEIFNQIKKANFLGSVLYIAAHPDDENTRLITYFANENKAQTAYLSLTRGDGGQNLIGSELRSQLGVIRTQELLEARKIDGGIQFFSSANDFGFSKNPDETLQIWDKNQILSDIVFTIRKFQPDIIINRFDHRTSGNTHGHHTASALLSVTSFDMAGDATSFKSQLEKVSVWQPKRLFFNPSWWFYGSKEKFDTADKSQFYTLETGVFYPDLGKSNQEIAALSRSSHQSQGFGTTGNRGSEIEYLELIKGNAFENNNNAFEGIDTSWNRVEGGKSIGILLSKVIKTFDFKKPYKSVPDLLKAYQMIANLKENHWKPIKLEEIKNCITACCGLYVEAVSDRQEATPASQINVKLELINRSPIAVTLEAATVLPNQKITHFYTPLKNNLTLQEDLQVQLPENLNYTTPFWLESKEKQVFDTDNNIKTNIERQLKVIFNLEINGVKIPLERTIVYRYNSEVQGEMYAFLDIVPEVTTKIMDNVVLFASEKKKKIAVKISAGKDNIKGNVKLVSPEKWVVFPNLIPFELAKKGDEIIVNFDVLPPKNIETAIFKSIATVDGKVFDKSQTIIAYNHIAKQQILQPAEAKMIRMNLKIIPKKIAYIMGAGDQVPQSLTQMGYQVSLIKPEDISLKKLDSIDVIITGIRAYNTLPKLINKQKILFDFVKSGKVVIVQYNTPQDLITNNITPFYLKISKDRVTDENAKVNFLAPKHPVLNYPNIITQTDFEGWKQEQGLYYPNEFDSAFIPILASNDFGESTKNGALLVAPYGKGFYVYTALSFFRELPEGVTGAYRLMANIISLETNKK